jgi:hypothetical protein
VDNAAAECVLGTGDRPPHRDRDGADYLHRLGYVCKRPTWSRKRVLNRERCHPARGKCITSNVTLGSPKVSERVQASGVLDAAAQRRLNAVYRALDPVRLLHQLETLQEALWRHALFRPWQLADKSADGGAFRSQYLWRRKR